MSQSYVWTSDDRPLAIHLSLDVVSRLGLQALEAYKSVPRRGLEVGGLLLGRTETVSGVTTIYIEDFHPVESEHRSGPSYVLSEADLARLDQELAAHPGTVGIYRTQTRSEELSLQTVDGQIFEQYFTSPDRLFLLISPAEAKAEFFVREDGRLVPVQEFPFRAADLVGTEEAWEAPATSPPPPLVQQEVVSPPTVRQDVVSPPRPSRAAALEAARLAAIPPEPPRRRGTWNWAIAALAVGLGAACGAAIFHYFPRVPLPVVSRRAPPTATAPAATAAAPHVALEVQRQGRSIKLTWDKNSPMIRNAAHAVLYIVDGKHNSQLDLDPRELNSGLVSYWPETDDVSFRLEVFAPRQSSDDSIRVVGGMPIPQSAPAPTPVSPATVKSSAADETPDAHLSRPPAKTPAESSADRAVVSDARPSPFQPAPKLAAAPAPVASVAAPLPAEKPAPETRPRPQIAVTAEPIIPSHFGALLGKIPLLRRIHKEKDQAAFVPPQPTRQPQPVLTAHERDGLTRTVPITVKVWVNDSGSVDYAELVSGASHRDLSAAAVYTARHWAFSPARLGDRKVESQVLLHFRFTPPEAMAALQ